MAEVKWIKIVTDIFDDEKILLIETLPEADSIIVIWFKLLCLAGKQNNSGVFMMSNGLAYTDEMLATIFRRKINIVRLALQTFEQFGMIEIINDAITIPNWSKHQTLDQLEERKEYMRNYMQKYREKQKLLVNDDTSKVNGKVNNKVNNKVNVNSLEEDIDKNKKENKNKEEKIKEKKKTYGEFKHVKLSDKEYQSLISDYGITFTEKVIKFLDEYIEEKGYKSKSHNLAIKRWVIDAVKEKERKEKKEQAANKRKEPIPGWIHKDIKREEATPEELAEMEEAFKEFKESKLASKERIEEIKKKVGS